MNDLVKRFEDAVRANGYRTRSDASEHEYDGAKRDLIASLTAAPASPAEPRDVAARIYEDAHAGMTNIWGWDDGGLDDEHPGTRERFIGYAKSAMVALGFTTDT